MWDRSTSSVVSPWNQLYVGNVCTGQVDLIGCSPCNQIWHVWEGPPHLPRGPEDKLAGHQDKTSKAPEGAWVNLWYSRPNVVEDFIQPNRPYFSNRTWHLREGPPTCLGGSVIRDRQLHRWRPRVTVSWEPWSACLFHYLKQFRE